jgi:uncharacterized protein (DUF1015 family)
VLVRAPRPAIYQYTQTFDVEGRLMHRTGFVARIRLEEFDRRRISPHERTFPAAKEDRLKLLTALQLNTSSIFGLYSSEHPLLDLLRTKVAEREPLVDLVDDLGICNELRAIDAPDEIAIVQHELESPRVLIADGHHRYETALAFRNENPRLADARRVMMTFVNLHAPGLRILATHRLMDNLPDFDAARFLERAAASFRVAPLDSPDSLRAAWSEPHEGRARIGVALGGSERLHLLEAPRGPREPDVAVLHQRLLGGLLGIGEEAVREERYLRYVRGLDKAIEIVRGGSAQMAFLLKPAPIEEVADISFSGGVMPQKSTDFYPKLLSGLTMYRIER